MKVRWQTYSRLTSYVVATLLVFSIGWAGFRIVSMGLNPDSKWKPYLDNGLISNLICTVLAFLIATSFSIRRRLVLPRISIRDDRKIFNASQLAQRFQLDPSIAANPDGGWRFTGDGMFPHSVARYNGMVNQSFAIAAQFKALRREAANHYWRTGFTFRRATGAEVVTVHIDNHNLLVGYIDGVLTLRIPVSSTLENAWNLLAVDISATPPLPISRVFAI